ncbi:MAG: signal peptidase I [Bacilli bacterium]|nr:signal peptidase I [Bacilli bacterium]
MKKNKEKEIKKNFKYYVKEIVPYILIIILVLLVKRFIVSPVNVVGSSMYDTLKDKDIMILNETAYYFNDIKRFDIVVIKAPGELIIKRVIGLPGEKIKYENGKLYINGKYVKENFTHDGTDDFAEVKIGKNKYFVMGDNRDNSMDSRYFGAFDKKSIRGRTSLTIYPFSRFGTKK